MLRIPPINMKIVEEKPDESLIPKDKLIPNYKWLVKIHNSGNIDLKENIIPTKSFITNNQNIPDLMFRRLCKSDYNDPTKSFITGSGLSINPKQFFLKGMYKNAQIEDASNLVASMIGTAVHNHMEAIEEENEIVEKRFVAKFFGYKVSAQLDHFGNGILTDYKVVKAWTKLYRNEKMKSGEYETDPYVVQINFNAYLLRKQGYKVDKARLMFVFKDYDPYTYKPYYPKTQIEEEWVPLWSDEIVENIVKAKLHALINIDAKNIQLHLCSDKEMWRKPTFYSLRKVGSSRALPKTKTTDLDQAERALINRVKTKKEKAVPIKWYDFSENKKIDTSDEYKGMLYVDISYNKPLYCESFCPGRMYCMQYQEWYCQNKKYPLTIIDGKKKKDIEMYGFDSKDALKNAKMIHNKKCEIKLANGDIDNMMKTILI